MDGTSNALSRNLNHKPKKMEWRKSVFAIATQSSSKQLDRKGIACAVEKKLGENSEFFLLTCAEVVSQIGSSQTTIFADRFCTQYPQHEGNHRLLINPVPDHEGFGFIPLQTKPGFYLTLISLSQLQKKGAELSKSCSYKSYSFTGKSFQTVDWNYREEKRRHCIAPNQKFDVSAACGSPVVSTQDDRVVIGVVNCSSIGDPYIMLFTERYLANDDSKAVENDEEKKSQGSSSCHSGVNDVADSTPDPLRKNSAKNLPTATCIPTPNPTDQLNNTQQDVLQDLKAANNSGDLSEKLNNYSVAKNGVNSPVDPGEDKTSKPSTPPPVQQSDHDIEATNNFVDSSEKLNNKSKDGVNSPVDPGEDKTSKPSTPPPVQQSDHDLEATNNFVDSSEKLNNKSKDGVNSPVDPGEDKTSKPSTPPPVQQSDHDIGATNNFVDSSEKLNNKSKDGVNSPVDPGEDKTSKPSTPPPVQQSDHGSGNKVTEKSHCFVDPPGKQLQFDETLLKKSFQEEGATPLFDGNKCIRERKVSSLSGFQELMTILKINLDPQREFGGDYRSLAGTFDKNMKYIWFLADKRNPTEELLQDCNPKIQELCDKLASKKVGRSDVVDEIEEWLKSVGCNCSKCGNLT